MIYHQRHIPRGTGSVPRFYAPSPLTTDRRRTRLPDIDRRHVDAVCVLYARKHAECRIRVYVWLARRLITPVSRRVRHAALSAAAVRVIRDPQKLLSAVYHRAERRVIHRWIRDTRENSRSAQLTFEHIRDVSVLCYVGDSDSCDARESSRFQSARISRPLVQHTSLHGECSR